jgi:predicted nucleic acid-binding Zn ribbon protein
MNETRCPISLDYFEPGQNILQINNCGHIFGHQPLMEWFQRHSRCPVCRASVLSTNNRCAALSAQVVASAEQRVRCIPLLRSAKREEYKYSPERTLRVLVGRIRG